MNVKVFAMILALIVCILFFFTFLRVQNDTKEINCITYYTSLGYTANGCEDIVKNFVENGD